MSGRMPLLALLIAGGAHAAPDAGSDLGVSDFADLELGSLLGDHQVTTSGRAAMRMSEVPESIWVITAEQIRRAGVTALPELLRLVPGMSVLQLTPGHWEVSARYNEAILASKLLVLIDGRPTYVNLYKTNLWASLPVVLEEIERIEVIYGPGSTLYGTSAVSGIVNIITRGAGQRAGALRVTAGPQLGDAPRAGEDGVVGWEHGYVGGVWWERLGPLGARLSVAHQRTPAWSAKTYTGLVDEASGEALPYQPSRSTTANLALRYEHDQWLRVDLRGGGNYNQADYNPVYRAPFDMWTWYADALVSADGLLVEPGGDSLELRVYHRSYDLSLPLVFIPGAAPVQFDVAEATTSASLLYRFELDRFSTTLGVDGELQRFASEHFDQRVRSVRYASAWLQERVRLGDLIATAGLRLQGRFTALNDQSVLAPKAGLVYSPAPGHVLRLSVGRGFEFPSLTQAYADFWLGTLIFIMRGNPEMRVLSATSAEVGYQYSVERLLTLKLNLFYGRLTDQVQFVPDPTAQAQFYFDNWDRPINYLGGELAGLLQPLPWLDLTVAYALHVKDEPFRFDAPPGPFHLLHLAAAATLLRDLELDLHGYAFSYWQGQGPTSDPALVNPLVLLNLRAAYRLTPALTLGLTGYNLLNYDWGRRFRSNAVDAEHYLPEADRIGRRLMLELEARL